MDNPLVSPPLSDAERAQSVKSAHIMLGLANQTGSSHIADTARHMLRWEATVAALEARVSASVDDARRLWDVLIDARNAAMEGVGTNRDDDDRVLMDIGWLHE